jgi:transglycosylase-like protein/LysM domain-containing protein
LAADNKADSTARHTADSKPARVRLIRAAAGAPVVTAAVAIVGVAGIAATAFALSSQTATHAGGNVISPTRTVSSATPKRAASTGVHASTAVHAANSVAPKGAVSKTVIKKATPSHKAVAAKKSASPAKSKATLDADKTVWFTVQSGDSLSSISGQVYGNANDWPVLYYANQSKIASADDISVGQVLRVPTLPATIPAAPATESVSSSSSSSSSTSSSASTSTSTASQSDSTVDASDYSGFQECVIERESGGNAQVMNSSGHYGLYQFSESTWVAYGGSPSTFGDATVAEQNAVFATAMADGGEDNWAPYDGC